MKKSKCGEEEKKRKKKKGTPNIVISNSPVVHKKQRIYFPFLFHTKHKATHHLHKHLVPLAHIHKTTFQLTNNNFMNNLYSCLAYFIFFFFFFAAFLLPTPPHCHHHSPLFIRLNIL